MPSRLIVTDLTRMQGRRVCVAGVLPDGATARLLPDGQWPLEDWLRLGASQPVRPFSRLELDLVRNAPQPPHTEDWWTSPSQPKLLGVLRDDERLMLLERTSRTRADELFGASLHHENGWWIRDGEGQRSLGTIRPKALTGLRYGPIGPRRWDYRVYFTDASGAEYGLMATDLAFRYYLDSRLVRESLHAMQVARDAYDRLVGSTLYFRIGLARGWAEFPERCYLQVTGVYTFPDYLDGRCWADLALTPEEIDQRNRWQA